MHPARNCRRCGAPLSAAETACPRCLLELGVAAPPAAEEAHATSAPARPLVPPDVEELRALFPDLAIEALIGSGGMGAVYRARQKRLDREVALKVLPRELSADRAFAERFLREARALARLSHPHIVAVHEYGETDGICWLLLEYVDGTNLRGVLRAGLMEPRQALSIVRELCEALQYAHDEGVVHRDIKPENVLVDRRGRAKVADFGLAKLVGPAHDASLTREGQVMGTPHYMAPEQIERPREVDHRADIYALGVVFYEMLTGSLPRGNFEPPSRRVHVDVRLDEIVLKALEHEPARRYQHAVDVKTDVDLVGDGSRAATDPDADFVVRADIGRAGADVEARGIRAEIGRAGLHVEPLEGMVGGRSVDTRRDPLRGWRGLLLAAATWIGVAAAWNLGPFAFGLALVVAVVLGGVLVHGRVRARPELEALLAAEPRKRRNARIAGAGATALIGLALVAFGHLAHWERGVSSWHPAWRGANGLLDQLRANPWSLMPAVEDADGLVQPKLAVSHSATFANAGDGEVVPGLVIILLGLVVLGLAAHAAVRVRERRAWDADALVIASDVGLQFTLAILVLWVAAPIVALRGETKLDAVRSSVHLQLPFDEALGRLRIALLRSDLVVDVEQLADVVDERTGAAYSDVLVLRGASASPFERWSTTWSGAVRRTPQVWLWAVRKQGRGPVEVTLAAGLYPPESPEARTAAEMLRSIEDAASAAQ